MQNNRNTFFQQNGINQLDRETNQKVIHFNTKFRNNYFLTPSSDFKYSFPLAINNVLSVRLRSIDIPNTWYTFSERIGNNKFIIETEMGRAKKKSIFEIVFLKFSIFSKIFDISKISDFSSDRKMDL